MNNRQLGLMLFVVTALAGCCMPFIKEAYTYIPPVFLLALRFSVAFLAVVLWQRKAFFLAVNRETIGPLLKISVFFLAGYFIHNLAFYYTTATNATFFYTVSILIIPFIAKAMNGTPYTKQLFVGIALVFMGIFCLSRNSGEFHFVLGDLLALGSAFFFSMQIVLVGRYVDRLDPIAMAGFQFGVVAVVSFIVAAIMGDIMPLGQISFEAWRAILLTGLIATVSMYVTQNYAQKKLSESVTGIILALFPLFTAISAWFVLGEKLALIGKIGGVFMLVGAIVAGAKNQDSNSE